MANILKATQRVELSVTIEDVKGNIAPVDGIPEWSSSDASVLAVTASADGMTATGVAGRVGSFQVQFNADADMGDGFKPVMAIGDGEVIAGEASVIRVVFGTPSEQPAA